MTQATQSEFQDQFEASQKTIKLLTLQKDEVASFFLIVSACPPEELKNFPPRLQSFHEETMVGFKSSQAYLFGGLSNKKMQEPKIVKILGETFGGLRYPVSATLSTQGNSLYISVQGDKPYTWNIQNKVTLYPPEETNTGVAAFTPKEKQYD